MTLLETVSAHFGHVSGNHASSNSCQTFFRDEPAQNPRVVHVVASPISRRELRRKWLSSGGVSGSSDDGRFVLLDWTAPVKSEGLYFALYLAEASSSSGFVGTHDA